MPKFLIPLALMAIAAPAGAQDREFCAQRPGLGTSPCTLAPGQGMAEVGLAQWDHTTGDQTIEDSVTLGDTLVRFGLTPTFEMQAGVGGYGFERVRDLASGTVTRQHGAGDGYLALKKGLAGPDGPLAIIGFVSLPVGSDPLGAGDWGAGVQLPATIALPLDFELDLTPEIDAAVNASGDGRHLAYGGVIGASHDLAKALALEVELAAFRDQDPAGHATDARVAASLAWQVSDNFQLDFEADAGVTAAAPGRTLAVGLARRF